MRDNDRITALAVGARQPIVARVAVELQRAVEPGQEPLGVFTVAPWGVEVDHPGRIIAAPTPVVARQRPEIAGFRPPATRVQHRRRGFVHEELGGSLQVLGQPIHDGRQVEGRHADPVGQRRAVNVDARAGQDL